MNMFSRQSFTLIELLIVVSIIGILAAIAIPNFLNAQVRAKVARCKSDLRSLATASDMYKLDNNAYPWPRQSGNYVAVVTELTTPVSYISSVDVEDPFNPKEFIEYFESSVPTYVWINYRGRWSQGESGRWGELVSQFPQGFALNSTGPDHVHSGGVHPPLEIRFDKTVTGGNVPAGNPLDKIYDPSNGVTSLGDIVRYGGEVAGMLND